ncbi:hypothetical protein CMK11_02050 [Candidatus Poribacteria bacterium]|jgi:hypothetical protein|nr:hypothetical protein [Candidatus Poribacteria bacterium]
MDPNAMDELRAVAAGLARWYLEEMPAEEQAAFVQSELGAEVRGVGFPLEPPAEESREDAAGLRPEVGVTA